MDFVKGRLVRSKAGRDKTRTFAVVAARGDVVWLADGNKRTLAAPKRKNAAACGPHRHCAGERAFEKRSTAQQGNRRL